MLVAYLNEPSFSPQVVTAENRAVLASAIWIDLLHPTKEEETLVEEVLHQNVPTREEMVEIELSSRLYRENGTLVMTANVIAQSDTPEPILDPVAFVLSSSKLVTIRYIEPQAVKMFLMREQKIAPTERTPIILCIEMLDSIIDRLADILEQVGHRIDDYSRLIFKPADDGSPNLDYQHLMQRIGSDGDLNTKACESLITFNRLLAFLTQAIESKLDAENQLRLKTISKDITSLSDHANFLSTKISFLLDATLGMVSIEQNNVIKRFSVAAVIFLPPTLVASIYGMNFRFMPELHWEYGYIFSIGLIALAAWFPYKYFKYKKWI